MITQELIDSAKSGNNKAMAKLFSQLLNISKKFIYTKFVNVDFVAREIAANECAAKIIMKLDKFDPERGKFITFATTLCNNFMISLTTSKRFRNDMLTDGIDSPIDCNGGRSGSSQVELKDYLQNNEISPIQNLMKQDLLVQAENLLRLAGKDYEVVKAHLVEELTTNEVAEKFNMNASTVRVLIFRYKQKIKNLKFDYSLN